MATIKTATAKKSKAETTKTTTAKKTAAKKPAAKAAPAKKPAAKAAPAKKTAAAKKPAAPKKPAAKAAPVKKTAAVKKPAAPKKPAAKAAPAKKPAAKAAPAKKPAAVKKPAAPKAAPVKKPVVVKKPAPEKKLMTVKPAAVKKPAAPQTPELDPNVKYLNLFDAYAQQKLPFAHGYIVSSFFSESSAYSIYEIVSYAGVKEIFVTDTGLQFVTGGKKLFVLVENDTYPLKYQEPVSRKDGERIPKRFSELECITAHNQTKIFVAKEPNESYGSFTVLRPTGINFSVVFYNLPEVFNNLCVFFEESLNKQRKVPHSDARTAAALIAKTIEKTMGFKGEFE
jgi:hypothetical protein